MFFSHFPKIVRPGTLGNLNCSVRAYSARKDLELEAARQNLVWFEKLHDCEMRRKDLELVNFYKNTFKFIIFLIISSCYSKKRQNPKISKRNCSERKKNSICEEPSVRSQTFIIKLINSLSRIFPRRIRGIGKTPGTLRNVENTK